MSRVSPDAGSLDAVVRASRALVGVAARSLDLPDDVTLPQFRALVLLARGEQRVGDLARELAIHPSSATRLVDRLVVKHLVVRVPGGAGDDRRETAVRLARSGATLVRRVTQRRREALSEILERLTARQRAAVTVALLDFADAAGEVAESSWELGWDAD